jgi:hypothetical protein
MKKIFFVLTMSAFMVVSIYGQGIPETINYQGLLKDTSGVIVPNGNYSITFKLYDSESGGTELWSETKLVYVIDGIVNTRLGNLTSIPASIFAGMTWLGITIETGIELTPRIVLSSVPYSFISMNVPDGSITDTKIANAQVVKSLNGIKDYVTLIAGTNITLTPSGNNITISSTGGASGIGGNGTTNYLSKFTGTTSISNSVFYETEGKIGLGTTSPDYSLTINSTPTAGLGLKISRDNGGLGIALLEDSQPSGLRGWSFNLYQQKLSIITTQDNGFSTIKSLITFDRNGNIGIGTTNPDYPLQVISNRRYSGYFVTDSVSSSTHAVHGEITGSGNGSAIGVYGKSAPADGWGFGGSFIGGYMGVSGTVINPSGTGLYYGVVGAVSGGSNPAGSRYGIWGTADGTGTGTRVGVVGSAAGGTTNWGGYFSGNVNVTGTISKGGGSFKIDHPLDPANKYLYHSFVESPDMKNIYDGTVITDASGFATVTLPDWFEALNKDFRYQLTVIGDFAQAIISKKISNNQFTIRTDKPNVEVCWLITGVRKDVFAEKYRIPVEELKQGDEAGKYLYPDAYNMPEEMGIDYDLINRFKEKNRD